MLARELSCDLLQDPVSFHESVDLTAARSVRAALTG
jgi:hypothetical protein